MSAGVPFAFRALWPITDITVPFADLVREASAELELVAARAHARPLTRGRFRIDLSARVPGSGRVTEYVLVFEAPAVSTHETCPRCRREVRLLVEGSGVCMSCDADLDGALPFESTICEGVA